MGSTTRVPQAPATAPAAAPVTAPVTAPAPLRERARGALLGLAVGDALGAPAENLKPSEIRARWGRITGYVAEHPAGTDDTEYAIFSGLLLARYGSALTPAHVETAWHEHIAGRAEGPFRGAGFSERGTLENLRRGLAAPVSAQHRHAWSDGLAMRAAPFGVFAAGRPAEAARLAAIDGSVSHEGEGIHGGRAVAAGVAAAMAGAPPVAVVAAALAVVPDDSWTARSLRRATAAAHRGERAVRSAVVVAGYPWSDLAPEAVALAFGAYAAADGDFRDAVLTAVNMGRDADTTAAVAGALAGATQGVSAVPESWAAAIAPARGSCLPSMTGWHVLEVADLLVARCTRESGPATGRREGAARTGDQRRAGDQVRTGDQRQAGNRVRTEDRERSEDVVRLDTRARSETPAGSKTSPQTGTPARAWDRRRSEDAVRPDTRARSETPAGSKTSPQTGTPARARAAAWCDATAPSGTAARPGALGGRGPCPAPAARPLPVSRALAVGEGGVPS
nr:ADP-ribosylglycohydrolase family protein [Streptomyces kebangsaanensis]